MNPSFTLIAILAFAATAQAQPVINAAQAPTPGTNYTLHFGPYIAPGRCRPDLGLQHPDDRQHHEHHACGAF